MCCFELNSIISICFRLIIDISFAVLFITVIHPPVLVSISIDVGNDALSFLITSALIFQRTPFAVAICEILVFHNC